MRCSRPLVVILAFLSVLAVVPGGSVANHALGITSISPTSGPYNVTVAVQGYGFDASTRVELWSTGCCFTTYPAVTLVDSGNLTFQITNAWMPPGNYTVSVYDWWGNWGSYSYFTYAPEDLDGDGWWNPRDCDDADPAVRPYGYDTPYDGLDQDCDGVDSVVPNFRAAIRGWVGSAQDDATFGVEDNATAGYDPAHDVPQPPAPPAGQRMEVYFHHPDNPAGIQSLSTSIQDDGIEVSWPLRVSWVQGSETWHSLSLSWDYWSLYGIPDEFQVYLLDGSSIYNMRNCCSVWFSVFGANGTRDFEILITTDAIESVFLGSGWSLVSLPVAPRDANASAVFGSVADAVYQWNGSAYEPATTMTPGVGYWVHNPSSSASVTVVGKPVMSVSLDLEPGWNLVGGPRGSVSLSSAPSHVSRTAFGWSGSGYHSTSTLWKSSGYWVYAHEAGANLTLSASAQLAHPLPPSVAVPLAAPPAEGSGAVGAPEFGLAFSVKDEGGAVDGATLAAERGARAGFDAEGDVMEAPRPAASAWMQAFFVAQGGLQMDRAAVPPVHEGAQHAFRVERSGAAGEVTLSWDASQVPEDLVVELVDGATRVDMRASSSYAWAAPGGVSGRDLAVVVRPVHAPVCLVALDDGCVVALPVDPLA